jgi:hypothetical protein
LIFGLQGDVVNETEILGVGTKRLLDDGVTRQERFIVLFYSVEHVLFELLLIAFQ